LIFEGLGLIVYLLLLFMGSIGLNWYGYLISKLYGQMLVIAFLHNDEFLRLPSIYVQQEKG
jgi:hypothetical protein